jgi:hypothetical protein
MMEHAVATLATRAINVRSLYANYILLIVQNVIIKFAMNVLMVII